LFKDGLWVKLVITDMPPNKVRPQTQNFKKLKNQETKGRDFDGRGERGAPRSFGTKLEHQKSIAKKLPNPGVAQPTAGGGGVRT